MSKQKHYLGFLCNKEIKKIPEKFPMSHRHLELEIFQFCRDACSLILKVHFLHATKIYREDCDG